jgi:hypothetical protein
VAEQLDAQLCKWHCPEQTDNLNPAFIQKNQCSRLGPGKIHQGKRRSGVLKVALTLLCRNEEDIVSEMIRFHFSKGVDVIIATDNGSMDSTRSILSNLSEGEKLVLIDENSHTHDQSKWVTRMSNIAMYDLGADWVMHADADEFWLPASGSFKLDLAGIPQDQEVLNINRTNFIPPDPAKGEWPFYESMTLKEKKSFNSLGNPLPPKVCHRRLNNIVVSDGNHGVLANGRAMPATLCPSIEIYHFPVRSFKQFEQKIRLGSEAIESNPRIAKGGVGGTWRYLYHEYWRKGALHDYYLTLRPGPKAIQQLVMAGQLVEEFTVRNDIRVLGGTRERCI